MPTLPDHLTHDTVHTNGIDLHVVKAGPADGKPVILLHGFPEFWYGWRHQIGFLAELGYRVWIPDQRGYNLSAKPSGIEQYTVDKLVNDVIGLIQATGHDSVYLVGHDWGGGVAWATAIGYPQGVEKLVILNMPHPEIVLKGMRTNPAQMLKSWYMLLFQLPFLPEALILSRDGMGGVQSMLRGTSRPGTFTDADSAEYIRAWKQPGTMTAMLNWYRALVQHMPSVPVNVRLPMSTLIIWGAQDKMLERTLAQPSIALCDQGKLAFIEEASHWVQHEEPERVNGLLREFFV